MKRLILLTFLLTVTANAGVSYAADSLNVTRYSMLEPSYWYDVHAVDYAGGYAYLADGEEGLWIVDVSDPANPFEVDFFDTEGYVWKLEVQGNLVYLADAWSGLRIVDVSNPAAAFEVGSFEVTNEETYDVTVVVDYAYVTYEEDGLRILDVSNPAAPVELGHVSLPDYPSNIVVSGDYAYISCNTDGLRIVDVSTPTAPFEAGFYDTPGYAQCTAVSGNYCYVADGPQGVRIIDVSDPANPFEAGFYFNYTGTAKNLVVQGNFVYLADDTRGLRIIDVTDPADPIETGCYDYIVTKDVAVDGDIVYTAEHTHMAIFNCWAACQPNFQVVLDYWSGSPVPASGGNITFNMRVENEGSSAYDFDGWLALAYEGGAPVTLVLRSFVNFEPGWEIERDGMFIPIPAGYPAGEYLLSLSVGDHPDVIWRYDNFTFTKSGSDHYAGFTPYPVAGTPDPFAEDDECVRYEPSDRNPVSASPNPFNPTTTISFQLSSSAFVNLAVYDVSGRLVAELVSGWRNVGTHEVTFDGSRLASGMYVCRLETGESVSQQKVVLIK